VRAELVFNENFYWNKSHLAKFKPHNDPAFKRRGDYKLVEVAKLIPANQVSIAPSPRPI
jgi:hypothetical protein